VAGRDALTRISKNDITLTDAARSLGVERTAPRRRIGRCLGALPVELAA
jgi:hypothetical protein